ncbi:MAG TPA: hypothetical protein LFV66_01835 [Rickettsia endosymbiont of Bembidion lapponicum]|nr:hypothetical protein [Rickettsia endosymbiont of Bembidion lapponicum]
MADLNINLKKKYEGVIKGIRKDALDNIGFYAQSLYTAAANNNGVVDIDNPNFKDAIDRSLGKERLKDKSTEEQEQKGAIGKDGYSVEGVLYSAEEEIKKLIKEGVSEEDFKEIREELKKYKEDLEKKFSSKELVTSLINDYIKDKGIVNNIGIVGENNSLVEDKGELVKKVTANFEIPEKVLNTGMKDISLLKPLHAGLNKYMSQCFAIDGEQENTVWCVIDRAKLTPENIDKFTQLFDREVQAFSVIQENLNPNISIEENKNAATALLPVVSKLSAEELQKKGSQIVKDFTPFLLESKSPENNRAIKTLMELDPSYLAENSTKITTELREIKKKGISIWEKFKSIFTGKDYLEERLEQSVNKYAVLSDEYVKKEIDNKIFSNALTNEQIAAGLTKLMNKTVEPKEVNNPNLNLVEIRKANPEIFDKLLFANQSQTSSKDKPSIHQENQKIRTRGPGL